MQYETLKNLFNTTLPCALHSRSDGKDNIFVSQLKIILTPIQLQIICNQVELSVIDVESATSLIYNLPDVESYIC